MVRDRLHLLDAIRGTAALTVVMSHWHHFFYFSDHRMSGFSFAELPFYVLLKPFFVHGAAAVDLFFSLSGFIFYRLYAARIEHQAISPAKFFWLRFSRLYPLHFATLLVVIAGQLLYIRLHDVTFVYAGFDLKHLLLNVALLSSVGLESRTSFNGPIWSVSVEVAMYLVFFLLCRWKRTRVADIACMALVGGVVAVYAYPALGRGLLSFFIGGLVHHLSARIQASEQMVALRRRATMAAVSLWVVSLTFGYQGWSLAETPVAWRLSGYFCILFTFPATILAASLLEPSTQAPPRFLSFLGDISYSSYLIHFPLQLVLVVATDCLGISRQAYYSPAVFLGYFLLLIPLAAASYRCFEKPAQDFLRTRWRV